MVSLRLGIANSAPCTLTLSAARVVVQLVLGLSQLLMGLREASWWEVLGAGEGGRGGVVHLPADSWVGRLPALFREVLLPLLRPLMGLPAEMERPVVTKLART